uniref:Uncharacterized protein n=1 Tax=Clastoptera arizonana TaxID=38151 RepID=A0A1B6BZG0_9HEMI
MMASSCVQDETEVLLLTAVVELVSPEGKTLTCRAFLDIGSQSNFITESVCKRLGLKKEKTSLLVTGVGHLIKHKVNVTVQSKNTYYNIGSKFHVIPKITSLLPSKPISINSWKLPHNIRLADPEFNTPNKIDILFGQELFFDILSEGQIKNLDTPLLQNTKLGWVLGPTTSCHVSVLERLDKQFQEFWKLEEPSPKRLLLNKEKQQFSSSLILYKKLRMEDI